MQILYEAHSPPWRFIVQIMRGPLMWKVKKAERNGLPEKVRESESARDCVSVSKRGAQHVISACRLLNIQYGVSLCVSIPPGFIMSGVHTDAHTHARSSHAHRARNQPRAVWAICVSAS